MAKNKDTGSWKLTYEVNEKDSSLGPLIKAKTKFNPNKIVVEMGGSIPGMTREQLAGVGVLIKSKVDAIDNTIADQIGNHITSLRLIAAYCNELADTLSIGEAIPQDDEETDDD